MPDHHDYRLDKDTPESIAELVEETRHSTLTSQHGLPAGERIHADTPDDSEDNATSEIYGSDVDRAMPGDFHGKADSGSEQHEGNRGK